jgi:hypothetical protein
VSGPTSNLDEAVRRAADVEPTARFPMKICLARLGFGGLTEPPPDEMPLWESLSDKLGQGYGEFAILNPLVAAFAETNYVPPTNLGGTARVVAQIRLGAARQHCDTVFVYEPRTTGKTSASPLQVLNLTIVGYFVVPSTGVQADGTAQGLLIDVRTGYPYAQLTGVGHSETFTTSNTRGNAMSNHDDIARIAAVADLTRQIPDTLRELRYQLAEHRAGVR